MVHQQTNKPITMDVINARQAKIPLSLTSSIKALEDANYNNGFHNGFVAGLAVGGFTMAILVLTIGILKK